jgi:hypothetical protein
MGKPSSGERFTYSWRTGENNGSGRSEVRTGEIDLPFTLMNKLFKGASDRRRPNWLDIQGRDVV